MRSAANFGARASRVFYHRRRAQSRGREPNHERARAIKGRKKETGCQSLRGVEWVCWCRASRPGPLLPILQGSRLLPVDSQPPSHAHPAFISRDSLLTAALRATCTSPKDTCCARHAFCPDHPIPISISIPISIHTPFHCLCFCFCPGPHHTALQVVFRSLAAALTLPTTHCQWPSAGASAHARDRSP